MLKPSLVLLSPGGAINYWWAYTTAATPLRPGNSSTDTGKKRISTAKTYPSKSRSRELSSTCRQSASSLHKYHRLRSSRNVHTSEVPGASANGSPDLYWHTIPPDRQPTPYDVLSQPPNGPYNKRRFAYLVKLYHPDLSSHRTNPNSTHTEHPTIHPSHLPTSIRIQRYHLLIQAHNLLSDPVKRAAYDRHGAGWASVPSLSELRKENSRRGAAAAREHRHNTPWHCATWEDWEEWWAREAARRKREDADIFANDFTRPFGKDTAHDAAEKAAWWVSWVHARRAAQSNFTSWRPASRSGGPSHENPQRPLYTSNGLFVMLIGFCTLTGAIYEWNRAGRSSRSYLAQLERANLENWADLNRRKDESRELESRAERLGRFLRDRSEDATFAERIAGQEVQARDGVVARKSGADVVD